MWIIYPSSSYPSSNLLWDIKFLCFQCKTKYTWSSNIKSLEKLRLSWQGFLPVHLIPFLLVPHSHGLPALPSKAGSAAPASSSKDCTSFRLRLSLWICLTLGLNKDSLLDLTWASFLNLLLGQTVHFLVKPSFGKNVLNQFNQTFPTFISDQVPHPPPAISDYHGWSSARLLLGQFSQNFLPLEFSLSNFPSIDLHTCSLASHPHLTMLCSTLRPISSPATIKSHCSGPHTYHDGLE